MPAREPSVTAPEESLAGRMQAKGLRLTHQHRILAKLLDRAEEHLDAEAVYRLARKKPPSIHRATVYRTLNTLKKLGFVDDFLSNQTDNLELPASTESIYRAITHWRR